MSTDEDNLKILILNHNDSVGGAARAAFRTLEALHSIGVTSSMLVRNKFTENSHVIGPKSSIERLANFARPSIGQKIIRCFDGNRFRDNLTSLNILPSKMLKKIHSVPCDALNLHWINGETISLHEISKLNLPILWTLHDMWPFTATEHLAQSLDYVNGYTEGTFLQRMFFEKKRRSYPNSLSYVAPSKWMAKCAKDSMLFKDRRGYEIPNPLDTDLFRPHDRVFCKKLFGISSEKFAIGFGGIGIQSDKNKGRDLLDGVLRNLAHFPQTEFELIVFGTSSPCLSKEIESRITVKYVGMFSDSLTLCLLYNALDLVIIPSRLENLCQVGTESQSCGTPVIAFDVGGNADILEHGKTGFLIHPFDINAMSEQIVEFCKSPNIQKSFRDEARRRAASLWNYKKIASAYYLAFQKEMRYFRGELPHV